MQKLDARASDFRLERTSSIADLGLPPPVLPDPRGLVDGLWGGARRGLAALRRRGEGLGDRAVASWVSVLLFALASWPLFTVDVLPYQDLPNHLAAASILQHPERYPEFVSNGFLKTNAALFSWLHWVGPVVGLNVAAKAFALLVLGLTAFALPRFVLAMTDRRRMLVASAFMWPMIHNWFVSMGMLDFALGVPLSLLLLSRLEGVRQGGLSPAKAAVIAALGVVTWYAHVFPLMVVHLLVGLHVAGRASWVDRKAEARRLLLPLAPATLLMVGSLHTHFTEPAGGMVGYVAAGQVLPIWELGYNLFAEWLYGFTWLSISTAVILLVPLLVGRRAKESVSFFSPLALGAMAGLYFLTPYTATNWFHVNSRFIPFLWMWLLVHLPSRLPRWLVPTLAVSAAAYSLGMGADFQRLDRERAKFMEGVSAVTPGAKLLPLVFTHKITSENTGNLRHLWGHYVVERQTSAPLLFAHSRSFPLMFREPPPARVNGLVLERFASSMKSPNWMCGVLSAGGILMGDCDAEWRQRWGEFWGEAAPRFDHVLAWDMPPAAEALVPAEFKVVFRNEKLVVFRRGGATGPAVSFR